ncbi:ABC transporter substrate-binding protein [Pseudactinotalea sp. Z1739]|uniref:ABC transporter substrate-binding protein n=1 Tax=Pseudactinotalea sp. Z1739 TaxID=3413028 RepID=UPI003C7BC073
MTPRTTTAIATLAIAGLALAACGGDSDPLEDPDTDDGAVTEPDADEDDAPAGPGPDTTVMVGSQAYYSNEIIAEIYAQALEAEGFMVERNFSIGQRDAYMPALESGEIDLFPEYTGNLLQFYDPDTEATEAEDVYAELGTALPENLVALDQAEATDQDSYNVTADFAEEHGLTSLADLAEVDMDLTLGGPAELEERPYGPSGLSEVYGVEVSFSATGDTTVQDLVAGTVDVGNVYSADPRIQTEDLVTLEDPEGLFLASHVVPLANADIAEQVAPVINQVSAALSAQDLVAMNVESTEDQRSPSDIAADWLEGSGILN